MPKSMNGLRNIFSPGMGPPPKARGTGDSGMAMDAGSMEFD